MLAHRPVYAGLVSSVRASLIHCKAIIRTMFPGTAKIAGTSDLFALQRVCQRTVSPINPAHPESPVAPPGNIPSLTGMVNRKNTAFNAKPGYRLPQKHGTTEACANVWIVLRRSDRELTATATCPQSQRRTITLRAF